VDPTSSLPRRLLRRVGQGLEARYRHCLLVRACVDAIRLPIAATCVVRGGASVHREVASFAREMQADLIVLGTRGRSGRSCPLRSVDPGVSRRRVFGGRVFGSDQIRAQIDAAENVGSNGWMLWNAANRFTSAGLNPAQPDRWCGPHPGGSIPGPLLERLHVRDQSAYLLRDSLFHLGRAR
jgi:Putative glycosyl hydrolase domain